MRIESTVSGKAIDVLASIDCKLEALEVVMNGGEWTSQLNEVSNIVEDIAVAGIAKASICAEDEQALTRIKEHLLRECGTDFIDKHQGKVQWRIMSEFMVRFELVS